jgi:hypothetical protein
MNDESKQSARCKCWDFFRNGYHVVPTFTKGMEDRLPLQPKGKDISHASEISHALVEDMLELNAHGSAQPVKEELLKVPRERRSLFRMRALSNQLPQVDGLSPERKRLDSVSPHTETKERPMSFMIRPNSDKKSEKVKDQRTGSVFVTKDKRSSREMHVDAVKRLDSTSVSEQAEFASPSRSSMSSRQRISVSKGKSNITSPESNSRSAKSGLIPHAENKEANEETFHMVANSRAASVYSTMRYSSKSAKLKYEIGNKCAIYNCQETRIGVAYCKEHYVI